MNDQAATISHAKDTLVDLAIRFGPRLLAAVVILIVGVIVSNWVSRWVTQFLGYRELEPPVRVLLARIAWAFCFGVFALMALQNLGVELLPLLAGLGVVGAGVALATQGVLSNIVAGLTIIFSKPFRVGEYVVPNRKVVGEILHNYGRIRQVEVSIGVAYESDLGVVIDLIRGVLRANPRVLQDPPPVVQPTQFGDSSISIAVKPWVAVQDQVQATGEIYAAVLVALRARGVVIPPPQREVRLIGQPA